MAFAPGYTVPRSDVEAFIANAARERGIDPNIALTVYRREGAGGWQSSVVKNGIREPSYGPFQLYTGGGLGNKFQKETGLDPRDPNTWQQNVTYALDEAKKGGWGPWYGAKAAGITGFAGINGQAAPRQTQVAQAQPSSPVASAVAPNSQPSFGGLLAAALQQQQPQISPLGLASLLGQPSAPPPPPPMPRKPIQLAGLAQLLQDAPPEVRGLLLQG